MPMHDRGGPGQFPRQQQQQPQFRPGAEQRRQEGGPAGGGGRGGGKATRTLCVKGLRRDPANLASLSTHFNRFGQVVRVHITDDNIAFVEFREPSACDAALNSRDSIMGDPRVYVETAKYDAVAPHATHGAAFQPPTSSSGDGSGAPQRSGGWRAPSSSSATHGASNGYRGGGTFGQPTAGHHASSGVGGGGQEFAPPPPRPESTVEKAQRLIRDKGAETAQLHEAIAAQKAMVTRLKADKANMSKEQVAAAMAEIKSQAEIIKQQQTKLQAAVRTAQLAVDAQRASQAAASGGGVAASGAAAATSSSAVEHATPGAGAAATATDSEASSTPAAPSLNYLDGEDDILGGGVVIEGNDEDDDGGGDRSGEQSWRR